MVEIQAVRESRKRLGGEKNGPRGQDWSGHEEEAGERTKQTHVKHGGPYPCVDAHV